MSSLIGNDSAHVAPNSELPVCPPYHHLSVLRYKSGYYPNIDVKQLAAVRRVQQFVVSEDLDFHCDEESQFLKLLRFLRARDFNVEDTKTMIRAEVNWRTSGNHFDLRQYSVSDILRGDTSRAYRMFPTWTQGYDKQDRPVSWRKLGQFDMRGALKLITLEELTRYHVWELEQLLRIMSAKSLLTGVNIETFIVVVDVAGWSITQATRDTYSFFKAMALMDSSYYPERLGRMIIINAPSMFSWAWRIFQGFLNDVQRSKITIHGSDPEEWKPVLLTYIAADRIPLEYGGTLPDLNFRDAVESLSPPVPMRVIHNDINDDATVKIFCGVPSSKKKKNKNKNKSTDAVETLEALTVKTTAATSSGWSRLLTCGGPPTCTKGDDDFDYTKSEEVGSGSDETKDAKSSKKKKSKDKGKRERRNSGDMSVFSAGEESRYSHADNWDARSVRSSATSPSHRGSHSLNTPLDEESELMNIELTAVQHPSTQIPSQEVGYAESVGCDGDYECIMKPAVVTTTTCCKCTIM